jgi:hypothetical protein
MRPTKARMHGVWCHLAAGLVATAHVALAPADARAERELRPLAEALHVEPGATCVTADALADHVRAWLGSDQVDADVWVRVEGSADDPRVVSFTMGRGGRVLARRRFEPGPDRCENLQAAVGLAIALTLRVSLLDDIVGPAPSAPAARSDVWAAGAEVLASYDVLPGTAVGAAVRVERRLPPNFELRLDLRGLGGWDKAFDHVAGAFDAALFAARLDGCVTFALAGPVGGRECLGFEAGGLFAQGSGFASPRSSVARWLAAADALGVTIDVTPRWSLDATLTLVLPLEHPSIEVRTSSGTVIDSRALATAGAELALGPLYRF